MTENGKPTLAALDQASYLHPFTNMRAHEVTAPLMIQRGEGFYVFDTDGKRYLDGFSALWCAALGFSNERLIAAADKQMRTLPYYHSFTHKQHDVGARLADRLVKMLPGPMSKVFFTSSGSEANDTMLKIVWYYNNARGKPLKKKVIARLKAYHGVGVGSAGLTGLPHTHTAFDLPLPSIRHTDCPHFYRFGLPGESEEEFASRLAGNLEAMILQEGPETVAAFIAEPVMGAGGLMPPPATYFEKIQPILKKYDVLMVADEVVTGFGRTGRMFGCQTYNIQPDIIILAKALTAAYVPLGAVGISDAIYQVIADQSAKIGTFGHGYTYSGHPVAAAVALEALDIYEELKIDTLAATMGQKLRAGLDTFASHPLVGEVRGIGMMQAVELVADKATKKPFDPALKVGPKLMAFAQARGLICRAMGDTIGFAPPLTFTEAATAELLEGFGGALADTAGWLKSL